MTRFENGIVAVDDDRYDGQTIGSLFNDSVFVGYYELEGNEGVQVDSGNGFYVVDRNYVVQPGDNVKFGLTGGVKGC